MNPLAPDYEALYQRAIEHYRCGELQEAANLLEVLEAKGAASPEALELLADIRLQLKLAASPVDFLAPPEPVRSIWPAVGISVGLVLLIAGAVALVWLRPWARPAVAAVAPTATVTVAPTVEPTAEPTAEPTVAPTAEPTVEPTVAPTAEPTAEPTVAAAPPDGQIVVRLPPGQSSLVRTPRNIAIVLDGSGSMRARVGEQTKMEIARAAVSATIAGLPDSTLLAMRTYGTQRSQDCTDLTLVQPLGQQGRPELLASVGAIAPAPEGMTPIGASLDALLGDLAGAEGYTAVLLVSDGEENCGGDPVASAQALAAANPQLRVHVIGFDIGDPASSERLRAIAQVGGGSYFDARDPQSLASALQEAVQLSYRVLSPAGDLVVTGLVGGPPVSLPPGSYRVVLESDGATELPAEVAAGALSAFELGEGGDQLSPAAPEAEPPPAPEGEPPPAASEAEPPPAPEAPAAP